MRVDGGFGDMPNTMEEINVTSYAHRYRSYLVRLWQDAPEGPWRAVVQNVITNERHGFATLEELCAFLQDQTRPNKGHS